MGQHREAHLSECVEAPLVQFQAVKEFPGQSMMDSSLDHCLNGMRLLHQWPHFLRDWQSRQQVAHLRDQFLDQFSPSHVRPLESCTNDSKASGVAIPGMSRLFEQLANPSGE